MFRAVMYRSINAICSHPSIRNRMHFLSFFMRYFTIFATVIFFSFTESFVVSSSSINIVKSLPGFGHLPFKLETGYIGVDEQEDVQLFYYFIESQRNPKEDPLVLWMAGGPGCSGLCGLVYEMGPLKLNKAEYNGSLPTLSLNQYSWTKVASIIYIDSPVGTGFSYSRSIQGSKSGDTINGYHCYNFMKKWLLDHPNFISNPLYVAGGSYSGVVVPIVVRHISDGNEGSEEPKMNLKGYVLGNPYTDAKFDENYRIEFAHRLALISDQLYKSLQSNCKGDYINVDRDSTCKNDFQAYKECTSGVNPEHVSEKWCAEHYHQLTVDANGDNPRRSLKQKYKNLLLPHEEYKCRFYENVILTAWANDINVQRALFVKKGTLKTWIRCNDYLPYTKDVKSVVSYHHYLNKKGLRALIYSGDHDMSISYVGTYGWIKTLNLSLVEPWRPWIVDGQVGGFTEEYSNHFIFATVKGAGHTPPEYNRRECSDMFSRWIALKPL